ncbi:MAG: NADH-quinone oxidoreductase subunit L [Acidimicrobiia bacterium]
MLEQAWLLPTIPAVSFVLILLLGKRFPNKGSEIGIFAVGTTFVLSIVTAFQWIDRVDAATGHSEGLRALGRGIFTADGGHGVAAAVAPVVKTLTWWQSGSVEFTVGTRVDGLVVMMLFVVTLISLLVHIYSLAYLRDDVRYTHYYAMLSLFTASMLLLVVSQNTIQMLVGWEGVGLCSFALIGHWWEDGPNSDAALKAFLTTRTGDIGLMIGIIVTFFAAGTFNIDGINHYALGPHADHTLLLVGAACLFAGVIGKSGQFPLHTWLPDAMAGPTPVSALIHAATMVVAGVFLVARLYPVFYEGFSIAAGGVNAMALIGGITILIGAVLAFVQDDIKKVLAYSTISQLGYMIMALGVGAWTAAVFHLFTHAFFKALLFLGAGSVSHSGSHHSFDMKKDMGGLRKFMPITFWTFMIGSLALAGIFPFAGFWSKDEILVNAGDHGYEVFMVIGLIGAFLTAAYMTRCIYLTFFGEYRGHGQPHESEPLITVPLIVLAVFSILAGFLNAAPFNIEKFQEWVEPTVQFPALVHSEFDYAAAVISVALATLGIGIAAFFFFRREELGALQGLTERNKVARAGYTLLVNKFYLDALYENVIVAAIKGPIARGVYWTNQHVIDGVVNGTGRGAVRTGRWVYDVADQRVIDGAFNGVAELTGETGGLLRYLQSGRVQRYALFLFGGVGLLSLLLLIFNT